MKVGFIGLGRMGQGMAGRIHGAGHDLTVYDQIPELLTALGEAGATVDNVGCRRCGRQRRRDRYAAS